MGNLLYEDLTYQIIGAAREVYFVLGPGYLESLYEDALCYELGLRNLSYKQQEWLDVHYKEVVFKEKFRADVLVENKVLIENKAIKKLTVNDEAQLINNLKITGFRVGLLFNFCGEKFEMIRRIL